MIYLPEIGRDLTLLYGIFSTFMIFFYLSNMRGNLVAVKFEKELKTFDDFIGRGATLYMASGLKRLTWAVLSVERNCCQVHNNWCCNFLLYFSVDEADRENYPISFLKIYDYARKGPGVYPIMKYGGRVPPEGEVDIRENGAAFVSQSE